MSNIFSRFLLNFNKHSKTNKQKMAISDSSPKIEISNSLQEIASPHIFTWRNEVEEVFSPTSESVLNNVKSQISGLNGNIDKRLRQRDKAKAKLEESLNQFNVNQASIQADIAGHEAEIQKSKDLITKLTSIVT